MSSTIVKLSFNSDLRRVRLDEHAARSYAALLEVIKTTFPALTSVDVKPVVQYEDDEGELITVGSDAELQEAFRLAVECSKPSVRFVIVAVPASAPASAPAPSVDAPVKRGKVDSGDSASIPSSGPAPTSAPAPVLPTPPTATPASTGVPVHKLMVLAAILRREAQRNPVALLSTAMAFVSDADVVSLLMRVMPLLPDMSRVLTTVAVDPALRKVLSSPSLAPHVAEAGISLDECVPAPAATPGAAPSSSPAFPVGAALFPMLLQRFADLDISGGFGGIPCAVPADLATDTAPADSADLPVHTCVTCDNCGMSPIRGSRFKCKTCPDYDLCNRCNVNGVHSHHELDMIDVPVNYQPSPVGTTLNGKPVHARFTCDGCEVSPIVGARFKCTVCADYDLCEACEADNKHPQHAMLKIRDASQAPAKLISILREDQHVGEAVHGAVDAADVAEGARTWHLHRGHFRGQRRHHHHHEGGAGAGEGSDAPNWRCGGRGGGRGRKHERTWGAGRCGPAAERSPSVDDPIVAAAIEESLKMAAAVAAPAPPVPDVAAAAPAPTAAVPAPVPSPAAVPVVVVKQDGEEYVARFVTHITLTDAAPTAGGAHVVKTWRMRNDGSKAWPEGTRLVHVGAETLGCPVEGVVVGAVQPGASVDISVNLVAPDVPGRHVGYFRLVTPAGVRFGHRIWADLFVENSNLAAVMKTLAPVASAPVAPAPTTPAPVVPAPAPLPVLPSPPAVVAPAEPSTPAWATTYQTQLLTMAEMGFLDIDANVVALEAHSGNVAQAIEALLRSA